MNEASSIIIPDASTLSVDTSCIDVSEVENQEDKDFLMEKGESILRIVAKAALEVGRELVEIQDRFKEEKATGLLKFYESIGLGANKANRWSAKYRAFYAYVELFGEDGATEKFKELPDVAGQRIWSLPTEYREALLADIAIGNPPTSEEVRKLSQKPQVRLSKAEELLEKAKARKEQADENWEMVKSDPSIVSADPEYKEAAQNRVASGKAIANFEQQIADLTAQIEEEKLKTAEEAEAKKIAEADKASLEKELQKLKFDDAKVRAERVKKLSTTLTVSIPQALADVSKFFAEIDHYPEEVRQHIYESAKSLANTIADKL